MVIIGHTDLGFSDPVVAAKSWFVNPFIHLFNDILLSTYYVVDYFKYQEYSSKIPKPVPSWSLQSIKEKQLTNKYLHHRSESNNHCGEKESRKRSLDEPGWRWGLAISHTLIQKDQSDTLTFERRPEGNEGIRHASI